jgi:hypothetical protein
VNRDQSAKLAEWVAARNLGEILARLDTVGAANDPEWRAALENAADQIRRAPIQANHDEIAGIAREANKLSKEAIEEGKRTRLIALLSFAVALAALLAQIFTALVSRNLPAP